MELMSRKMHPTLYRYQDFLAAQASASSFARGCSDNLITAINRPDFPCYFAKHVITKNTLHMAFVEGYADRVAMFSVVRMSDDGTREGTSTTPR